MKLSEYIEMLQHKLAELPQDPDVAFTQAGYYSDGAFAYLYDEPQIEEIQINESYGWVNGRYVQQAPILQDFLVLGHSYQSY
ncbi:hypothetical protein 16Q_076 [Pseudomonas phage 16Q]|nr:hypothetical protein 16Q_076 [Pseudomonas phage 16Q]